MTSDLQWKRRFGLQVLSDTQAIDLSEMHVQFMIGNSDEETPNTASIRIFNLNKETADKVQIKEFSRVIVQAGYEEGPFGVLFDGTIMQFRRGRMNATDTYLDILAACGDQEYNFGIVSASMPAGTPTPVVMQEVGKQMGLPNILSNVTGGVLPRGKVLWGMGRTHLRQIAATAGASWSIQNGGLQMSTFKHYLPGEAVVLNSSTGMIGVPIQTDQGISVRCLINPKIRIGGLVQLNNKDINTMVNQDPSKAILPYDQWAGTAVLLADVIQGDGFYCAFVVEHHGDTRGEDWYSDIVCLAVDKSAASILANN